MLKIIKGLKPHIINNGIGITTHVDAQGTEYVRVTTDEEDFCIAPHNYTKDDVKYFTWYDAMKALEATGTTLPTKEQTLVYIEHLKEINDKLNEIGGEAPKLEYYWNYWTSTEYDTEHAWLVLSVWCYNGCENCLDKGVKNATCLVRPVIDLIK